MSEPFAVQDVLHSVKDFLSNQPVKRRAVI
jgi:hypothetical protein